MAKMSWLQKKLQKTIYKKDDPADFVEAGWSCYEKHDYQQAAQHFTAAIESDAKPGLKAEAHYGIALIEFDAKEYLQVRERLRGVLRDAPDFPKRPELHFILAQANEMLWREFTKNTPSDLNREELLQRAIDHYEQAIERRSAQSGIANVRIGKLYHEINQPDKAMFHLQRAYSDPNLNRQAAFETAAMLGGISRQITGDIEKANEYFLTALKKEGSGLALADVYRQLGLVALQRGKDDDAIERFEQAVATYKDVQTPDVLESLINLAELKSKHHWLKDAVQAAERAQAFPELSKDIRQRAAKVLAISYAGLKEHQKAEEHERQFLDVCKDPHEKAEGWLRLGAIYEHLSLDEKAADAYRKGLKSAAHNLVVSKLNGALGRLYLREDRMNPAFKHLKEAIQFATEKDEHAASLYRLLGECHIKRNEIELAIEQYGTIIAKFPNATDEPFVRTELKNFRKQFKKEIQDKERARQDAEKEGGKPSPKAFDTSELERLTELVNEILDEKGFFQRLKDGLSKTHLSLVAKIETLLASRTSVDDDLIENLEEILILADLGVQTTGRIIEHLQESVKRKELQDPQQVKVHLKREIQAILHGSEKTIDLEREKPLVILVIGVNGTGKTTTIGKMASKFKAMGKEVLLVAGDTFRAAAIEQLEIWGERSGCEVIKHASGSDPSAVMYDAIHAAKSRNIDVVIADTAGRLQTKKNLMEELKKMVRVISRELPGAPHEILMVIDSTTGQNAISQAKLFHEGVGVSGIILTKLDGTAKGGIIVSIANDLHIPVLYIGIGEGIEDLREFHSNEFVEALFED